MAGLHRGNVLIANPRALLGVLAVIAGTGGACDSAATRSPVDAVALEPFAQHPVRLSETGDIALVSEATACVRVSYESAVACYDPQGAEVALWGSEGEGPGEFPKGGPRTLVRMGSGRLGAWNSRLRRLSVFGIDGAHIVDLSLAIPGLVVGDPVAFRAGGESGDRLWLTAVAPTYEASFATIEIDLATQRIVSELHSGAIPLEEDQPCEDSDRTVSARLRPGAIHPSGSIHFFSCRHTIVHLSDPEGGGPASVARMPNYREEFPSEREVADHRRGMQFLGPALEDQVDKYRRTPKLFPIRSFSARAYDADGRLWVGTRAAPDSSEIDIYDGTDYVATVVIGDKLEGFDIHGSTMAAVVERPPRDTSGIPGRGLDWYDISSVRGESRASTESGEAPAGKARRRANSRSAIGPRSNAERSSGVGIVNHGLHNVNQTLQLGETSEAVQRGCSAAPAVGGLSTG